MPDLNFSKDNRAYFPTKYHGEVSLSKGKWDEICQEPERFYYRDNAEKVPTTLVNPESVRHSKHGGSQFIYYKKFDTIKIGNKEVDASIKYWAVVIDSITKRICTVYPTLKPRKGKEYNHKDSQ